MRRIARIVCRVVVAARLAGLRINTRVVYGAFPVFTRAGPSVVQSYTGPHR